MEAADNVEFGDGFAPAFAGPVPYLVERHGVGLRIAGVLSKGAETAASHADVGRIDVAVDVEISSVAVKPFPHNIREIPESQNVGSAVKGHAVIKRQTLAGFDSLSDRNQAWIFNGNLHVYAPGRRKNMSAAQNRKNSTLT